MANRKMKLIADESEIQFCKLAWAMNDFSKTKLDKLG